MRQYFDHPQCSDGNKYYTVGSVIDKLTAFKALHEARSGTASVNNAKDLDANEKLSWTENIRKGIINCGGEPTDLEFFQNVFGGATKTDEAADLWIKYNCEKDYNIIAEDAANAAAGQAVTFQLLRSLHAGNGKYSNVAVNGNIYIYEDDQWLRVTNVDTTTDYGHLVTAVPHSQYYAPSVRAKKKMMFNPVRIVDGYSCNVPSSTWQTPGYAMRVQPFRIRKDWELPLDLLRPYRDILKFALSWDNEGNEVNNWETYEKIKAREEFKYMKNLTFFMGQKIDNPLLLTTATAEKYAGFDGYIPSIKYGGGFVYPFDPTYGFDLDADFQSIIMRQDALKMSSEFLFLHALPFMMGLNRRSGQYFKDNAQITFETFRRAGEAIERLGVTSMKYLNSSLHFKLVSAWSDTRGIGNDKIPFMGFGMPGTNLRDSRGNEVSAIEFYNTGGNPETGSYEEIDRDHRKLENGCEKLSGTIAETFKMAVHCPKTHILLDPMYPCS